MFTKRLGFMQETEWTKALSRVTCSGYTSGRVWNGWIEMKVMLMAVVVLNTSS